MKGVVWGCLVCFLIGCGAPKGEPVAVRSVPDSNGNSSLEPQIIYSGSWASPGFVAMDSLSLNVLIGVSESDLDPGDLWVQVHQAFTSSSGFSDVVAHEDMVVSSGLDGSWGVSVSATSKFGNDTLWFDADGANDYGEILFSGDGTQVAVGTTFNQIQVWEADTGALLKKFPPPGESTYNRFFKVRGTGQAAFYHGSMADGERLVVDAFTHKVIATLSEQVEAPFWWSGELAYLAGGEVRSVEDGRVLMKTDGVGDVTPNARYAIGRSSEKTEMTVISLETGKVMLELTAVEGEVFPQTVTNWGSAVAIPMVGGYRLLALDGSGLEYRFWPVWTVQSGVCEWYLEASDGRWAGVEAAAGVRGMTGKADAGLVKEFIELTDLGQDGTD